MFGWSSTVDVHNPKGFRFWKKLEKNSADDDDVNDEKEKEEEKGEEMMFHLAFERVDRHKQIGKRKEAEGKDQMERAEWEKVIDAANKLGKANSATKIV